MKSIVRWIALISLICATGCETTGGTDTPPLCPAWVLPLTWSPRDTEDTQREIFAHNLKWEEFCATP